MSYKGSMFPMRLEAHLPHVCDRLLDLAPPDQLHKVLATEVELQLRGAASLSAAAAQQAWEAVEQLLSRAVDVAGSYSLSDAAADIERRSCSDFELRGRPFGRTGANQRNAHFVTRRWAAD
jgi:hypothetical protein